MGGGEDSWAEWGSAEEVAATAEATAAEAEAAEEEAAPSAPGERGVEPPSFALQEEPSPSREQQQQQQQQREPAPYLPEVLEDPVAHRRSDPGSGGEDEFGECV